jgi:hypothetical protein
MVLPYLTAGIPEIGNALSPMHLPVIVCGGICGPLYGGIVGLIAPIFRSLVFGMPSPLVPRAISMAAELLGYGVIMGVFIRILPKRVPFIYASLGAAMLGGRIMGGICKWMLLLAGFLPEYSFGLFWSGYFVESIPAIILQLLLVPPIIYGIRRAKLDFSTQNV